MHKCLQDALTLTSRFHKPDLFITMTANPKWSEIQDQLQQDFLHRATQTLWIMFSIRRRRS